MSGVRNELMSIAIEVNSLLSKYIAIHNTVFKFAWRRIIPLPFIFKSIDFNDLHAQAKQILSELEVCNERINNLIESTTQEESRFAHFLLEYCIALSETISLLRKLLYQLYLKSQNLSEYSLSEHNKLCDLYKKSVNIYHSMGSRLNQLFAEFNKFEISLSKQASVGVKPREDLSEKEKKNIEERLEEYRQKYGIESSDVIKELFNQSNKHDEMLSKILKQPQIIEVSQRYRKEPKDIEELYFKLIIMVGEYVAQSVIENPKLLSQYLQMTADGFSEMKTAFTISDTILNEKTLFKKAEELVEACRILIGIIEPKIVSQYPELLVTENYKWFTMYGTVACVACACIRIGHEIPKHLRTTIELRVQNGFSNWYESALKEYESVVSYIKSHLLDITDRKERYGYIFHLSAIWFLSKLSDQDELDDSYSNKIAAEIANIFRTETSGYWNVEDAK